MGNIDPTKLVSALWRNSQLQYAIYSCSHIPANSTANDPIWSLPQSDHHLANGQLMWLSNICNKAEFITKIHIQLSVNTSILYHSICHREAVYAVLCIYHVRNTVYCFNGNYIIKGILMDGLFTLSKISHEDYPVT